MIQEVRRYAFELLNTDNSGHNMDPYRQSFKTIFKIC